VIEFVVVAFAGALHEPGVDLGAELDFCHGCWGGMIGVETVCR
jgi:hypothetical protein